MHTLHISVEFIVQCAVGGLTLRDTSREELIG